MKYSRIPNQSTNNHLARLSELIEHIDPDVQYGDWLRVLMAIFYETRGSKEGFELADAWSSKGSKYCGSREIRSMWDRFNINHAKPVTAGTLVWMANKTYAA